MRDNTAAAGFIPLGYAGPGHWEGSETDSVIPADPYLHLHTLC